MLVRFIKPHPAGIPEGAIRDLANGHAERLKREGYAEDHVVDEAPPVEPVDPAEVVTPPVETPLEPITGPAVVEAPVIETPLEPATVDYTKLKNAELEAMLTEKGIPFEAGKLKKAKLIELLTNG